MDENISYVFVVFWGTGVVGLAVATIFAQLLSAGLTAATVMGIFRKLSGAASLFSGSVMREILRLGIPSMIQHVMMSFGQLSLQNVINSYGVVIMAGYSIAFRMNGLVINSLMALSNALSGFIAQNKGAGKYGRIQEGLRVSLRIAYGFSAAVVMVFLLWGWYLLSVFIKDSGQRGEIIAAGMSFLQVVTPFYLLVCLKIVYDGALRGIGAMNAFMLATMSDVVVRVLFGRMFSDLWGLYGVWAIWPLAWLLGTTLSVGCYQAYAKKIK